MTPDQFVKAKLSDHVYQEGASSGHDSMLAIALILRNRVRAGWAGGDWMGVLNSTWKSSAFDPVHNVTIDLGNQNLRRFFIEVDEIYQGTMEDKMTEGGLYYYDTLRAEGKSGDQHRWFIEKILRQPHNHPRVAQVGMIHIFR